MFRILFRFLPYIALFLSMTMAYNVFAASFVKDELRQHLRLTKPKANVTQVIDGETFIINNTETIHLPAIYIPVDNRGVTNNAMAAAKEFLEKELSGKAVSIYQVRDPRRGQTNSLGHAEGYVLREDGWFVQEEIVKNGLAFAYPTQSHYEFADKLYIAEENARDAKVGLWSDPQWAIMTDQQAKQISTERFVIIEGVVKGVATKNNVIYLNFERDWRKDFTVAVDSSLRRDFSKYGINLMQMINKPVRVRGWVRDYNGPYMEIFHPSQMELPEQLSTLENSDSKTEKPSDKNGSFIEEDTIKQRVLPNSAMFPNPTLQDVTLPEDNLDDENNDSP